MQLKTDQFSRVLVYFCPYLALTLVSSPSTSTQKNFTGYLRTMIARYYPNKQEETLIFYQR